MAKKHKHEEHVNHERWVISFADMMTLLFALFVVLYAMGQQDLEKLKQLKESIQVAFSISGSGKTKDEGIFDYVEGAGEVHLPAPLVTAQDRAMREFLDETLEDFREEVGTSLEINLTSDAVSLTASLSKFFEEGRAYPMREEMMDRIDRLFDGSLTFTSSIDIRIETPNVPLYQSPDGRAVTSVDLCIARLRTVGRLALSNPQVLPSMVTQQWTLQNEVAGQRGYWEDRAKIIISFSNARPENR